MSFNIGDGSGGGGFNLPKTTATATLGSTGLNFAPPATSTAGTFRFPNPATSQPSAAATPFNFGLTPAATTSASTTGGLFSTPTSSQPTVAAGGGFLGTATPSTSTFSFSNLATTSGTSTGFTGFQLPSTSQAATTAASSPFGQLGQIKPLGGTATDPAKTTTSTLQSSLAFPSKPATGSTLLVAPTAAPSTTSAATTTTTTTSAPAPATVSGFPSLSTPQTSTTSSGLATMTMPSAAAAPLLPTSTPILTSLTTATSTSSAATGVPAVPGVTATLSVAGLEEKVNKWMSEMREQEERLMRQAAHVNAWDQLLQQGHDQVQQLRHTLNNVKTDQNRLQAELDFIQGQQQELEQLIEPLEAAAASTTPAQHQGDRQRENMHLVAQNLDSQLRQITDDLCKVIEHLNSNNSGSHATDPVNTVARVLSAHMDTLKWVDQNSALLSQKIDELSRVSDSKRRD